MLLSLFDLYMPILPNCCSVNQSSQICKLILIFQSSFHLYLHSIQIWVYFLEKLPAEPDEMTWGRQMSWEQASHSATQGRVGTAIWAMCPQHWATQPWCLPQNSKGSVSCPREGSEAQDDRTCNGWFSLLYLPHRMCTTSHATPALSLSFPSAELQVPAPSIWQPLKRSKESVNCHVPMGWTRCWAEVQREQFPMGIWTAALWDREEIYLGWSKRNSSTLSNLLFSPWWPYQPSPFWCHKVTCCWQEWVILFSFLGIKIQPCQLC